ncbi:MAG: hypothetical protein R2941_04650 [Desulfobacterales bacterium]
MQYVNAHGTSTPRWDLTEIECLRTVFGRYMEEIPVLPTNPRLGTH